MGSQGLEGCQVPLGLEGRLGQGAHLEPLDQKDQQAPVVHQDSQEGEVSQVRLVHQGLQAPQHQPVPASQNQTTIAEKTPFSPTPFMILEGYLFQDLRGLPGLLVPQVLKAQ